MLALARVPWRAPAILWRGAASAPAGAGETVSVRGDRFARDTVTNVTPRILSSVDR
jgi:hypothetical protein